MTIASIKNCGLGLNADLTAEELGPGYWSAVENMRFSNGYAARFDGVASVFTAPAVTPYFITQYSTTSKRFWVHAGIAAVYVDDGATRTDITGTAPTGTADNRWTGGTFNGVLVMNNGVDVPTFWGGDVSLNLATLTGWTSTWRAVALRPFKNFLIALGITKGANVYPHMVKWSAAAEAGTIPVSWDEANAALDAGEQNLAETDDLLVDCLPMGDVNIIYKERSMYSQSYIGAPYIFRFQRLPGDVGILARGCVAAIPDGHVVLTQNDVVIHAGQGTRSIANGAVRQYIFDNLNITYFKRAFVVANHAKNEVWVCFPYGDATNCDRACVYNYIDQTWTIRTLTNVTYGAFGEYSGVTILGTYTATTGSYTDNAGITYDANYRNKTATRLLVTQTTPLISMMDDGDTDAGATISASMTRSGMHFDSPDTMKTIRSVYPRIDGTDGEIVSVQVGASMYADKEPTWQTAQNFTIGQSQKIDSFATGRFMSVRFTNYGAYTWRIRSFDIDYVVRGYH